MLQVENEQTCLGVSMTKTNKKQEQVENEQKQVSDEMPAVPPPDIPSRVNDEAEVAARRAQQVYLLGNYY